MAISMLLKMKNGHSKIPDSRYSVKLVCHLLQSAFELRIARAKRKKYFDLEKTNSNKNDHKIFTSSILVRSLMNI